jgi:hypothetical protein
VQCHYRVTGPVDNSTEGGKRIERGPDLYVRTFPLIVRDVLTLSYSRGNADGVLGLHRVTCHHDQYLSPAHVEHRTPILRGIPVAVHKPFVNHGEFKICRTINAQWPW